MGRILSWICIHYIVNTLLTMLYEPFRQNSVINQWNAETEGEKVEKSIISGKQDGDLQDNLSKYSNSSQVSREKEQNRKDELNPIHENKRKLIEPRRKGIYPWAQSMG